MNTKTIDGITIHPITNLVLKKRETFKNRYAKVLQNLPEGFSFSVPKNGTQLVYKASKELNIPIKTRKLANGRFAVFKKNNA